MNDVYNIYCDESCHLEHDNSNAMAIGAIWCPKTKIYEVNKRIKEIKFRNGISDNRELKWVKVSPAKIDIYKDLINYFFDDSNLHFRCVLVPNKSLLDHNRFKQTHDDWYYKMYFEMLKIIFDPSSKYNVYIDIKDTNSHKKAQKLHEVCCNSLYDFSSNIIKKVQTIRSDEVQIMQLVDLLIGAICNNNRKFDSNFVKSKAKTEIIDLIKKRSGYSLKKSTLYKEDKLNIFVWEAYRGEYF